MSAKGPVKFRHGRPVTACFRHFQPPSSNAVKVTLGPKRRNVVLDKSYLVRRASPRTAFTVAKEDSCFRGRFEETWALRSSSKTLHHGHER